MSGSVLRVREALRRFGPVTAVDRLSLDLASGEILGLLGPNGAGKTTLIRMITGLDRADGGSISLFEGLSPAARGARSRIGYVPQNVALYPELSVLENIRFFGGMYGLAGEALSRAAEEAVRLAGLDSKRSAPVRTLSGGMMRRTLLASAVVHRPSLLILDEPTAGVDPVLRVRIWDLLRELAGSGAAILITTHHIAEASRCDRIAFLREGRLIGEGTPAAMLARYGKPDLEAAFVAATGEPAGGTP